MANSSAWRVAISHCWLFKQVTFKIWCIIEIWMVVDDFPFHLLLRIHCTVPFWMCSLTSRSLCHGITFINFPYCGHKTFSCLSLVKCFVALFAVSLGIVRMIYSFHSNIPVGAFAQSELCPELHTLVHMCRRLCFHVLVSVLYLF